MYELKFGSKEDLIAIALKYKKNSNVHNIIESIKKAKNDQEIYAALTYLSSEILVNLHNMSRHIIYIRTLEKI